MRNTINYITIFALLILTGSCSKILNQDIQGSFTPDKYFNSNTNALLAVNAAYRPLTFNSGATNAIWVLGDIASDDAIKGGLEGDQADFDAVDKFNILPTNSAVEAVWKNYYNGVFLCNVVLDGIAEGNTAIDEATRNSCAAQAKFLRAYYYFVLTNAFGDIPLQLSVETGAAAQKAKSTQDAVFLQIEKDCLEAFANLPLPASADLGRASKGAAKALLAKAYLFHTQLPNHYTLAAQAAADVVAMGYELTPKYYDNFSASTKNNKEAIFTINHIAGTQGLGNDLNSWFAPKALNGIGFFYPTQSLVDNYEKAAGGEVDPRLDYTVARNGHPYFDVAYDNSWSTTGYLSKKMVQPLEEVPTTIKNVGTVNYEALRLSDILLVQAEALNESGQGTAALAPLNKVRKRARESYLNDNTLPGFGTIPAGLLPDVAVTDQAQLRDIIRRERRSELGLEFQRFFDVIRYGSAYATAALTPDAPAFNYTNNKWFPIPQSERDANPNWSK